MKRKKTVDGREIVAIGTAHVSEESKKEVKATIEEEDPDLVCVELDENRLNALKDDSKWKELEISEAIRDGQAPLLMANLLLSIYQRRMGMEQNIKPGTEMLEAVEVAEEKGEEIALIDRDINKTLKRGFSRLSLWEKSKLLGSFFLPGEKQEIEIEELKESNIIQDIIEELGEDYPSLKEVFLDERNSFMAEKLMEKDFEKAVVVVGAAHLDGFMEEIESPEYSIEETKKIPWSKIAGYGLPAAIIAGIAVSFYSGFNEGITNLSVWLGTNSFLAMLGAIAAKSHPVTWAVSFISSPFTSLNPAIPAGLVAAYSESKIKPPKVGELEAIGEIKRYRELWGNQVGRILLVFFLVNLGSGGAAIISFVFILLNSLIGI